MSSLGDRFWRLVDLFTHPRTFPLMLFSLAILAYGLLLPQMGFYWDDWPWVWIYHQLGAGGLLKIDASFRPLAGEILWLGAQLAGDSPLVWQALNLVYRWLAALSLWWMLGRLWPRQAGRAAWIACLFLVYPGFTQQFISINSSRHILPLAFFFLSLGCSAWAVRSKHAIRLTALSLGLSLVCMLTTEYTYGLELLRPAILWLAGEDDGPGSATRLKRTLVRWAPYLLVFVVILSWRSSISASANYPVTITGAFAANPTGTLWASLQTILGDMRLATASAWSRLLDFPDAGTFGERKTAFYWILVCGSTALAFLYLRHIRAEARDGSWKQVAALGLLALGVGGLPFLATGLPVDLSFPSDRGLLPLMLGGSLLLGGLLDALDSRRRSLALVLLAIGIGLGVGWQTQNAVAYQRDWKYQAAFLQQLAWRVPGLQPGTALLTEELPNSISTDNSLTAPLNWMYAGDVSSGKLPYVIYYLDLRLGTRLPALQKGLALESEYFDYTFHGSTDHSLVMYYAPPACLRVLHPKYDAEYPHLPELTSQALPLADLDAIQAHPSSPARLPPAIFGVLPEQGWCYYFQKADLARQQGDWEQVARIGDIAFELGDSPNHASERLPFIQGYAYTGQWERARKLTEETIRINKFMRPMLCAAWEDLALNAPETGDKSQVVQAVGDQLDCGKGVSP